MGKIEIEGMEFFAYHGHFKAEQIVGNRFLVDIAVETDTSGPEKTDRLDDAVDYQLIYKLVKREMGEKSHLLENIAGRIIQAVSEKFNKLEHIKVKVSKMNPPMGGKMEKVSVTLEKSF
jgi:7,8-dihydroneopterin aldolase/epimerase/oxygenase